MYNNVTYKHPVAFAPSSGIHVEGKMEAGWIGSERTRQHLFLLFQYREENKRTRAGGKKDMIWIRRWILPSRRSSCCYSEAATWSHLRRWRRKRKGRWSFTHPLCSRIVCYFFFLSLSLSTMILSICQRDFALSQYIYSPLWCWMHNNSRIIFSRRPRPAQLQHITHNPIGVEDCQRAALPCQRSLLVRPSVRPSSRYISANLIRNARGKGPATQIY